MYIDEHGRKIFVGQEALIEGAKYLKRLREAHKLQGRTTFQDLPISVENRKGSVRKGTDDDGEEWRTKMKVPYGYIPGTEGVDGDELDVFVGPDEDAAFAYVVHCNTPDGEEFDEDKVMLGFKDQESAKRCFLQHYDDPKFFGGIDEIPMWKFREKAFVKKHTTKKLVASRAGASLQLPADAFEERLDTLGRGTDQDMKLSMLGHHPDIMEDPEVREAEEHGVKGMKWGVRHARQDAAGQKGRPAPKRDLSNDSRTLSMMQVVHRSQEELNQIANAQIAHTGQTKTPAQPQKQLENNHGEALNALKELGWKILQAGAMVTGTGGILQGIQSIVKSPAGQKLFLSTSPNGSHTLTTDKQGKIPASQPHQVRRTRTSFREAKKTYYARPLNRYGKNSEARDIEDILESFPGQGVKFPRTRRHAELGMGYFHKKIDAAKRVVLRPDKLRRVTAGVFSEATHALKKKIPVFAFHKGKIRRVSSVEALRKPNREGHFGRVIFRKLRRKQ